MGLDLAFFAAPDDERALEAERRPGGPLGWPEVTGSRRSGLLRREPVVTVLGPADGVGTRGYDPVLTTGTLEALLTGRDVEAVLQDPRSGGAPGGGDEVLEDEHLEFLRALRDLARRAHDAGHRLHRWSAT